MSHRDEALQQGGSSTHRARLLLLDKSNELPRWRQAVRQWREARLIASVKRAPLTLPHKTVLC